MPLEDSQKVPIFICDTQPVAARGLQCLLAEHRRFTCDGTLPHLEAARRCDAGILVIDRAFGQRAVVELLTSLKQSGGSVCPVVWGTAMTDAEALRYLQAGARGILFKTTSLTNVLACLEGVSSGQCWMEEMRFSQPGGKNEPSGLTSRETQVMELVQQGFKNREIAAELGIRVGTVKIHLKHIFEKTGVHGRYGLALNGLKESVSRESLPEKSLVSRMLS